MSKLSAWAKRELKIPEINLSSIITHEIVGQLTHEVGVHFVDSLDMDEVLIVLKLCQMRIDNTNTTSIKSSPVLDAPMSQSGQVVASEAENATTVTSEPVVVTEEVGA